MFKRIIRFLKKNFFPLLIVLITSLLCLVNYKPGTWLSGWDTLHPEFNFPLNFKRVISGVWREEQGLGAVAGHSHMADLPRIFILWLLSFYFPTSCLRYLYIFLCLILGPLGVYYFLQYVLKRSPSFVPLTKLATFLGALFYLLNLGTLQHFYVPFEMFQTFYAALPWLFLSATKFLEKKKQSDLITFSLVTLFATPMAYAAHLWYAYFLCFCLYLFTFSLKSRNLLKRASLLIPITLLINSFWLLPNIYFLFNHAQDVPLAKANRLFSEEAFLAQKEFGTIKDTAILKNFLFNWSEHMGGGRFGYLLDEWIEHLRNPWVTKIGYAGFIFVLLGILITIFKKEKRGLALLPIFLVSFIFLINMNPPFEKIFSILRENPVLREGLRFPFTKFSIPLMFTYAIYFAIAQTFLLNAIKKLFRKQVFSYLFSLICFLLLIIYMLPAFSGNLISPSMKIKIPKEYFQMFSWFKNQKEEGRIAYFPIHNLYGWIYYDWGYQGAGFLWFGIDKPFLDRDFDRWTPFNEEYYREMSYAVYSQNLPLLERLLDKYQIKWVLLDESVISPGKHSSPKVLFLKEIKEMFSKSKKIKLAKSFNKLKIYQTDLSYQTKNFTFLKNDVIQIEPSFKWADLDLAYLENDIYYSEVRKEIGKIDKRPLANPITLYPFRSFKNTKDSLPLDLLQINNDSLVLKGENVDKEMLVTFPNYFVSEIFVPAQVFLDKTASGFVNLRLVFNLPQIVNHQTETPEMNLTLPFTFKRKGAIISFGGNQNFTISNDLQNEVYLGKVLLNTTQENFIRVYDLVPNFTIPLDIGKLTLTPELCSQPEGNEVFGVAPKSFSSFEILTRGGTTCINLSLSELLKEKNVNKNALLKLNFSYISKDDIIPKVCLFNQKTGRCLGDLEADFFVVDTQDLNNLAIRFISEANNRDEETRITYENVFLSVFYPQYEEVVSTNQLKRSFEMLTPLKMTKGKLSLKSNLNSFKNINLEITEKERSPKICGSLLPKSFNRQVINENGQRLVEYSSQKGAICDFFEYPNLPHDQGYLLLIEAKNISGLPLRVCLANHSSQRCDLYTDLSESKDFQEQAFVAPPMNDNGFGYNLHLNNYSIGNIFSINQVKSVKIIPFPYNWLKGIKLINNPLLKKNSALLIFSQSFDPGWVAFYFDGLKPVVLKKHILVNNWANGWKIGKSNIKYQKLKIRIIYLPQCLEYLGFLMIIGFFAWTVSNEFKNKF